MSGSIGDWLGSLFSSGGGATGSILGSGDPAMDAINTGISLTNNPMPTGDPAMDAINMGVTMAGAPTSSGSSGGFDMSKLGGALSGAAKAATGNVNQSQSQQRPVNMAQGRAGSPIDRASLAKLVQMLQQRDDSYFPTGGQVGAQPIPISKTLGLLGF
jgi:hypothetical protein